MSLKALDERMQEGYKLSMEGDTLGACDVWMQVWEGIEREMDARQIATVDRFDPVFDGEQSIENWAPRFEMELHNAILDDREYARMCVDFCSAFWREWRIRTIRTVCTCAGRSPKPASSLAITEKGRRSSGR